MSITVLNIMEQVGSRNTKRIVQYINDGLNEIADLIPDKIERATVDVKKDVREYNYPSNMKKLLAVYRKDLTVDVETFYITGGSGTLAAYLYDYEGYYIGNAADFSDSSTALAMITTVSYSDGTYRIDFSSEKNLDDWTVGVEVFLAATATETSASDTGYTMTQMSLTSDGSLVKYYRIPRIQQMNVIEAGSVDSTTEDDDLIVI